MGKYLKPNENGNIMCRTQQGSAQRALYNFKCLNENKKGLKALIYLKL